MLLTLNNVFDTIIARGPAVLEDCPSLSFLCYNINRERLGSPQGLPKPLFLLEII